MHFFKKQSAQIRIKCTGYHSKKCTLFPFSALYFQKVHTLCTLIFQCARLFILIFFLYHIIIYIKKIKCTLNWFFSKKREGGVLCGLAGSGVCFSFCSLFKQFVAPPLPSRADYGGPALRRWGWVWEGVKNIWAASPFL